MSVAINHLLINWQNFNWFIALGVFASYMLIDGLYARYTFDVVKLNASSAASVSFIMHFLLAFGVINYVGNYLYVVPIAVGSWIGTYAVVKWEEKSRETQGKKPRKTN